MGTMVAWATVSNRATKFESLPSLKFPSTHRRVHIAFSTSEQEEISGPSLIIFLLKETERVRER